MAFLRRGKQFLTALDHPIHLNGCLYNPLFHSLDTDAEFLACILEKPVHETAEDSLEGARLVGLQVKQVEVARAAERDGWTALVRRAH
jgi:hypothetical protein